MTTALAVRGFVDSITAPGPQDIQVPKFQLTEDERFALRLKAAELAFIQAEAERPGFALETPAQVEWANRVVHSVADAGRTIEEARKRSKARWMDEASACDAALMPLVKAADALKRTLGQAIARYTDEQARQHAAAFQLAAAASMAGQHQQAAAALAVASVAAVETKVEGVGVRKVWKHRIVDAAAVERVWCAPDEKRIAAMVKATKANSQPIAIAGVQFWLENETRIT